MSRSRLGGRGVLILSLLFLVSGVVSVRAEQVLWLYAKDPANWQPVAGGARGQLEFDPGCGIFRFAAQGLAPQIDYALVRHDDDPRDVRVLKVGRSDSDGHLQLYGEWRLWSAKFWLLPVGDLEIRGDRAQLKAWHPHHYLFENRRLVD